MMKIRVLSIFFAVVLMFGCTAFFTAEAAEELNYGKMKLSEMERAEDYIGAYDAIYEAVENEEDSVSLEEFHVSGDEFDMIYELYRNDAGEHYYGRLRRTFSYGGDSDILSAEIVYEGGPYNEDAYDEAVAEYVSLANGATSEYEKALILHDALVENVFYQETSNSHGSYGALVEGVAVCEGYAEAYQVLLEKVGIMSYVVRGWGGGERHAWNLVRLDGKFYYTDLTWDDAGSETEKPIFYAYFNMPEKYFFDHTADDIYEILPECVDVDMMYEDLSLIKDFTVENVAGAFKSVCGQAVARIYELDYEDDGEIKFFEWLSQGDNLSELAAELNLYGMISAMMCGAEIYIKIDAVMPEHVYDDPCDTDCNICGSERYISHRYGLVWCSDGGRHWHECVICGAHADESPHISSGGTCSACGESITIQKGDVDGEDGISANDAIYLLYRVFFGETRYPVNQECDFNADGTVSADDAIYLLYRIFFGETKYPLH